MKPSKNVEKLRAVAAFSATEPYTVHFGVVMNPSSNFQTGSVLLLTATVVCGALGVTLVAPMLQRDSFAQRQTAPPKRQQVAEPAPTEKFAEFYPTIEDGRKELERLEAAAGPVPQVIRQARLASESNSASRYLPPRRTQYQPATQTQHRQFAERPSESVAPRVPVTRFAPQQAATAGVSPVPHLVVAGQVYSPQQLPPGTVYAPVTVNVDSSSLAEQMQQMSVRFEELVEQKNQAVTAAVEQAEKKQLARKQRQQKRPTVDPQAQQQIVRIEAGLLQLAESVNALQSRTQTDMQELALQKSRAEAASQLLENYERTLSARLQSIEASHAELKSPTRVAMVPDETYSDGVPFPVEAATEFSVVESPESAPEVFFDVLPDTEPEVTLDEIVPPAPPEPAPALEPLPALELFEPPLPEPEVSAAPALLIETLSSEASFEEPVQLDGGDAQALVIVESDEPQTLLTIPAQSLSPIPPPPTTTLQDIMPPETAPPVVQEIPALPTVGYENVYRFKLADVEAEEGPTVVPGDGPVCPQCGLLHGPGEAHSHQHLEVPPALPAKIRTVSNTAAGSLTPQPVSRTMVAPTTPEPKKTIHRTAARGSNRHVRNARLGDSPKPVWDVQLPSISKKPAADTDRPSFMHRVGSTLKQLTR